MEMAEICVALARVVHHSNPVLKLKPEDGIEGIEVYSVLTLIVGNYRMKFVKRKSKEGTKIK